MASSHLTEAGSTVSAVAEPKVTERNEVEALIVRHFAADAIAGMPIYLQCQNAIRRLVQDHSLAVGAQLPSDTRLASLLGVSLGTIQKALGNLANQGWVRREHGRGTFIAAPRRALTGAWHFRFRDPDTGERLAVYSKVLKCRNTRGSPAMLRAIGEDPNGYVEITRLFDISGRLACFGRLWLGARRFGRLLDYPAPRLEDVNLKDIFAAEFDSPTVAVRERICATALAPDIARHLGDSANAPAMRLEVVAYTRGGMPFSFQEIFIPCSEYPLDITVGNPQSDDVTGA
jgi:DNA-binding GntR family transcriptional regulator